MKTIGTGILFSLFLLCFSTGTALADSRQLLGSFKSWDAFVLQKSDGEKVCYIISVPKRKTPTTLQHGNPFITVSHKPKRKISNELNFVVGYGFRKDSTVTMVIDKNRSFKLFTSGDGAWGYDAKQDNAMASAMKRGSNLVMNATSGRGNATSYQFSLSGFTAAHNAITKACR
ncbi:invasion associated locus B family protein [Emcibacter sp.]|uniref:invasion associated locus B family protein n=1 Tax=Emcibacter sp. TaxID=1979954 RepID=UPI002AA73745|nr:invasion associated locus B family protein [Emcibacter sp.]